MKKRPVEALLRETEIELVAGEALLAQKKTAEKRAKSKLARRNATRSAKTVKRAVASIAAHRELLEASRKGFVKTSR